MSMLKPEGYEVQLQEISGWKVNVVSYAVGDRYHCHVDNVDPGTIIAQTDGPTREEAQVLALAKAHERLTSKTK